jgi:tRNA dimethylallyltransferase
MLREKRKNKREKIIVIAGPTASGKTEASLTLSAEFNGAILSCDSRQIYRELDVATDKILTTAEIERQRGEDILAPVKFRGIDHYGLSIAEVSQTFTLYDWQQYAHQVIKKILSAEQQPFLVGGTGLYIQAVIENYELAADFDPELRAELNKLSLTELQSRLKKLSPTLITKIDQKNPRRLVRAIEKLENNKEKSQKKKKEDMNYNALVLAFRPEGEKIRERITARVARHQELGVIEEVRRLVAKYGADNRILNSTISVQEYIPYIQGRISLEAAQQQVITDNYQYAKRQLTWFDKYGNTIYCRDLEEMQRRIKKFMDRE